MIGNTTLQKIDDIYFKCEFENPTGSVKDRSISVQVQKLKESGFQRAVISSSGNAAISAAFYCQKEDVSLTVFVSTHVNAGKLKRLKDMGAEVLQSKKAVSESMKFAVENKSFHLRQSLDPNALVGYKAIAQELSVQIPQVDAVFVPTSSGTMFVGIALGLKNVAMHVVQTSAVHPIAEQFDGHFVREQSSLADGIVARVTAREKEILNIIKSSKGKGWIVNNLQIVQAYEYLKRNGINTSYEGAAALAGLWKAKEKGVVYRKPVVILSGSFYES